MSAINGVSGSGNAWAALNTQRQAKMFAKVDTDSSGGVDKAELQTMLSDISKKSGVSLDGSTDDTFSKMDSNGDGSLNSDELSQGMQALMPPPPSTMDFAQGRGGPPPPGGPGGPGGAGGAGGSQSASGTDSKSYDPLDTNKDGTVSELERLVGEIKDAASAVSGDGTDNSSASQSIAKLAQQLYAQFSAGWSQQSSSALSAVA